MNHKVNIIDDLRWRYATKEFDTSRKVPESILNNLLEATRLSASSFGLQPWKIVQVSNQETKEQLVGESFGQKQVAECSDLFVFTRHKSFGQAHIEEYIDLTAQLRSQPLSELDAYKKSMTSYFTGLTEVETRHWMDNQVYLALGNLLTVAATMKVDACPMGGFSAEGYNRVLNLAEKGLESVVICPIGYRSANDKMSDLPKVRYPLSQLVTKA